MTPHRRFLVTLVALLLLANLLALAAPRRILQSKWFLEHADDHYTMMLAHHLAHRSEHNELVILGDSAGMMGVNAQVVTEQTGHAAVNLSLYGFSGFDAWRLLIDHYLDHNALPHLVVLYIVPMSLAINDEADHRRFSYETAQILYRIGDWPAIWRRGRQLVQGLSFVYSVVARAVENSLRHTNLRAHLDAVEAYARESGGASRMDLVKPGHQPIPLDAHCSFDDTPALPLDGLLALRRHLEERGTRVIVYIAPTPECDHALARYHERLDALAANPIRQRPPGDFYDRSHMSEAAATANSRELATFISGVW